MFYRQLKQKGLAELFRTACFDEQKSCSPCFGKRAAALLLKNILNGVM